MICYNILIRTVEEPPLPVPEYQPPSTGRRVRRRYRSKMPEAKPVSGLFYHVPVGTRYYSSVEDIGRTPSGRQNGRARLLLEIDPKGKYYPILDQYKGKDGSIQPLNIGGKDYIEVQVGEAEDGRPDTRIIPYAKPGQKVPSRT